MKILVTGRNGQVGRELSKQLHDCGEVIALDRSTLDLADPASIVAAVRRVRPQVIVNAAAYTAVDKAETDRETAFLVNAMGAGLLAAEARAVDALLVHYSTDYVFDGRKSEPYLETDPCNPVSVYGESKLAGEQAVQASGARHLILRTAWVYAAHGGNFLRTMIRLARERPELRVVADQRGAPTWAGDIARTTRALIRHARAAEGIYHLTAAGETTWHGFAEEIVRRLGTGNKVTPITTAEYPTPARRPRYSVLSNERLVRTFGVERPNWMASLDECWQELAQS